MLLGSYRFKLKLISPIAVYLFFAGCLCAVLLGGFSHAQTASVQSQLSSSVITRDETVTLDIVAIGLDEALDVSALEKDFDVVGRASSREVNTVIGSNNQPQVTSTVRWTLELVPKGVGVFTVPAVKVGDMSSQIHTLTVNELPTGAQRQIFIEASVDTDKAWVQSQVILTLQVFLAVNIIDGGLDAPEAEHLVVEQLGDDSLSTLVRDGRQYRVTTRKFAIFPQKSGSLTISPIALTVTVPRNSNQTRGLFQTRKLIRRTEPITLEVLPRPSDAGNAWWLPAQSLSLSSEWIGGLGQPEVNKPLTRSIRLEAVGVASSQLPDISVPDVNGMSIYAEPPQRLTNKGEQGLASEQIVNWAIIPQQEGTVSFPEVTLQWFNTGSGAMETVTLPEETIVISAGSESTVINPQLTALPSATVSPNPTQDKPPVSSDTELAFSDNDALSERVSSTDDLSSSTNSITGRIELDAINERIESLETSLFIWRSLSLFLMVGGTVLLIVYRRQLTNGLVYPIGSHDTGQSRTLKRFNQRNVKSAAHASLNAVEKSCQKGDPEAASHALLEWATQQWLDSPPRSLHELADKLPDSDAASTIRQIDELLYGRDNKQNLDIKKQVIAALPEQLKSAVANLRCDQATANETRNKALPEL